MPGRNPGPFEMERTAIYTCITGGYDRLIQPSVTDGNFDFICFVGPGEKTAGTDGVWQIRELDAALSLPPAALSRWPKLNPHKVLPEYEWTLWIDANVGITGEAFYEQVLSAEAGGTLWTGFRHPFRDDVREEVWRCYANDRISFREAVSVLRFLRSKGFPRHCGLLENNVILRRSLDGTVVRVDEMWWESYRSLSRRDQLTLGLCFRECGLEPDVFRPEDVSARNHPALSYNPHLAVPVGDRPRTLSGKLRDARRECGKMVLRLFR